MEIYKAGLCTDDISQLGEGPCWDEKLDRLLWLDIFGYRLVEYYPSTGNVSHVKLPFMMGTIALTEREEILMAGERGIYFFRQTDGGLFRICDPEADIEGHRFNDGKVGPDGRFWAGGVRLEGAQNSSACAFYRMDTDFSVTKVLYGIDISNGLAWNVDGTVMYYIDSPRYEIWAFDYDMRNGSISGKRVVAKISPHEGMPDGMTIDNEGMLWVALWRGGCVVRIDPSTGCRIAKVEIDAPLASCPIFGGQNMDILYITSAQSISFGDEPKTLNEGRLFQVHTGVKGSRGFRFPLSEKVAADISWGDTNESSS